MRLYLIRHAAVTVLPERPSRDWHLSPEGRAAAEALAREPYWSDVTAVFTSAEPKAVATAQRIAAQNALPLRIDAALREVERPWAGEGYRELVRRYLAGEDTGWEPRDVAQQRISDCLDSIVASATGNLAAASHGLVLTLFLARRLALDGAGAFELWQRIAFPDVAVLNLDTGALDRPFGGS